MSVKHAELEHAYGERVHILHDAFMGSLLANIGSPETPRNDVLAALRIGYELLLARAAAAELPQIELAASTRMADKHGARARVSGPGLDPAVQVVVCDVIRGGLVPAQTCFERLSSLLSEDRVRLDHVNLERTSDSSGRVTGADLTGSKIGGTVDGAYLFFPDPMGATGSTISRALEHYRASHGEPAQVIVLPLIATPEFLMNTLALGPNVSIWCGRVDRGMSAPDVLDTPLGSRWEEERGLDDTGYIVPGAGGLGEVLNNSWV